MDTQLRTLQALLPRLQAAGDKPAVIAFSKEDSETWSYAKLAEQASRLASGLADEGVEAGEHIALWAEPSPRWIAACLGILACGAVAVPLDAQLGDDALAHALKDCDARYAFTTDRLVERWRKLKKPAKCKPIILGESAHGVRGWEELQAEPREPEAAVAPEDQAVLFYTSGTTGAPKGVPLTHKNLTFQLEILLAAELVTSRDRVLLPLPLHHVYPFTIGLLTPLALGLPIVLPYMLTGPQLMRALKEARVTIIIGVPRLYRAMLAGIESHVASRGRLATALFRSLLAISVGLAHLRVRVGRSFFRSLHRQIGPDLRVLATGGAAMDTDLAWQLEGLGWQVATGYGLTETSPLLTLDKPGEARIGSVGRPIEGVELRIEPLADERDRKANDKRAKTSDESEGEIVARGPSVFAGYLNLPDKTKEAFTDDGWFRTGDLGYLDHHGYLHVTGRVKTLIVLEGGEKVQPDEVEKAFEDSTAIAEIGVLADNGKLVGVVRPKRHELAGEDDQDHPAQDAIRKAIEERSRALSSYQRVSDFVLTNSPLPRTQLGKIRREVLQQLYEQLKKGGRQSEHAGPIAEEQMLPDDRGLLEDAAASKVWEWLAQRFRGQPLSPDTNLQLDLGIDSLEWLNLTMELRQCCEIELADEAIGRIETVRDLLREVVERPRSAGEPPPADPLEEPDEVLGDQRRIWLAPLGPVASAASRFLYGLNWLLVHAAFRLQVEGREGLPDHGPFVLAPNHSSYLDSFVLAAALDYRTLRDTYWAGWTGVANGPVFRVLRRLCHVVPIDSARAAAAGLAFGAVILRDKHGIVWYPEGGHSKTGELMPLRPGIGMLLKHYPVPVVPVHLEGTRDSLPPGNYLPRPGTIRIKFGAPLDPHDLEKLGQARQKAGANGKTKRVEPHERITRALHEKMARLR
jgi:long-chain acyl-CoA synthetase